MATLYTHTFADYTGVTALPATFNLSDLSPDEGTTHAIVSSITVMFYKPLFTGTYTMGCKVLQPGDEWSDYITEDVIWAGETTQIITFTFPGGVNVSISHNRFEVGLAARDGPAYTTYAAYDTTDTYFVVEGEWSIEEDPLPGKPTTPSPADSASDVTLSSTTGTWVSGGDTDSYNVYYGTLSGFLELVEEDVTDLSLALVEGNFSVYGRISYWRVDAVNAQGTTQGDEWVFTTMLFYPPLPTGVTLDHSGGEGGVPTGTPTGESNMMTVRKLVVAAENKIYYENI